jgi:7 transmembrane sweet-taste receptor of 3 GCPR/Receptor family ligand binding region
MSAYYDDTYSETLDDAVFNSSFVTSDDSLIGNCSNFTFNITIDDVLSNLVQVNESLGTRTGLIYGLISPESSSLRTLNVASEWAALLAVNDFNRRSFPYPGVTAGDDGTCNFQLKIKFSNYSSLMDIARNWQDNILFLKESQHHPMAMLGAISSPESALLATLGAVLVQPYFELTKDCRWFWTSPANQILNLSPISTSQYLNKRDRFPNFARTIPSNSGDAVALCRYLASVGVTRLAVLFEQDMFYGSPFYTVLKTAADGFNISLFPFPYGGDSQSLVLAVRQMKATPFRYVFCISPSGGVPESPWNQMLDVLIDEELLLLSQQESYVNSAKRPWQTSRNTPRDENSFADVGGSYAWFFSNTLALDIHAGGIREEYLPFLNRTAVVSVETPEVALSTQRKQFLEASQDPLFLQQWRDSQIYGTVNGSSRPHAKTHDAPEPSLMSLLTYDAVLALGMAACTINTTQFLPKRLYEALLGLEYTGTTGNVRLDDKTASRSPDSVVYVVQNVLHYLDHDSNRSRTALVPAIAIPPSDRGDYADDATYVPHDSTPDANVTVLRPLIFPYGSTTPPPSMAQTVKKVEVVPIRLLVFLWLLFAAAVLFSIACAIWTVKHRRDPKVRAGQPVFLVCLCCGVFLVAFSGFFLTWNYPYFSESALNAACIADPWFLSFGLTTIFAAQFSKIWRIHRVYRSAQRFRRVKVRVRDVLGPFLVLMSLNLIILTVWTVKYPLKWTEIVMAEDSYGRVTSVQYTCFPQDETALGSKVCLYLLMGVCAGALVLLNIESYRARNLPSEFNETIHIAMTNLILLEALIIAIPLLLGTAKQRGAWIAVRGLLNFVICMGVLLPAFLPKFSSQKGTQERRTLRSRQGWGRES